MDPISIVNATLGVAGQAFKVCNRIRQFVKAATHVERTVEELAEEVNALGDICYDIGNITDIDISLSSSITPQLARCRDVLDKLDNALPRASNYTPSAKAKLQVQLNLQQDDINEYRRQLSNSTTNLQLSLHLLQLKAVFLAPKLANQELLNKLEELAKTLDSQGQRLDDNLVSVAGRYITNGQSLYTQSNVSVAGTESTLQQRFVSDWVNTLEALSSSQDDLASGSYETATISSKTTDERGYQEAGAGQGIEFEEQLARDMTDAAIAEGSQAFHAKNFDKAETMLRKALVLLESLPARLRQSYVLNEIHFQLAVCTFHQRDLKTAEADLSSIVNKQSTSDSDALQQLEAGSLLAQVYVMQNNFELALRTGKNVLIGRWRMHGKDSLESYKAVALLSRICELFGDLDEAAIYKRMLPPEHCEEYCHEYDDLHIINAPPTGDTEELDLTLSQATVLASHLHPSQSFQHIHESTPSWLGSFAITYNVYTFSRSGMFAAAWSVHAQLHYIGIAEHLGSPWLRQVRTLTVPTRLALSQSGTYCAWMDGDSNIVIHSLETEATCYPLLDNAARSVHLKDFLFTSDGQVLLTIHFDMIQGFNTETGERLFRYAHGISNSDHQAYYALSDDDKLAMILRTGFLETVRSMHVVDARTGKRLNEWQMGRNENIMQMTWSNDSKSFAVILDKGRSAMEEACIYSPKGKLLRKITLTDTSLYKKNEKSYDWECHTWAFLEEDIIHLARLASVSLGVYDSSVKKWWKIDLGPYGLANPPEKRQSLDVNGHALLRLNDGRLILIDIGEAVRHCRSDPQQYDLTEHTAYATLR